MTKQYDNIPTELTEQPNWVVFRLEWDEKREKYTKRPYDAKSGFLAKSNDPSTWCEFDLAVDVSQQYDGIGYMFDGNYYGVDLDNVESEIMRYIQGDDEDNIVADFMDVLCSYSEISPSGTGVHIICKGQLPDGGRRKGDVEMYGHGRFFTMTGNRIGDYKGIFDDTDVGKIKYLHHKHIGESVVNVEDLSAFQTSGNDLTESQIIAEALKSKQGMRFQLFMDGGWEQFYHSQSEADLAFCNDLAFWTACDTDKMDAIFRKSSLMRDKWDSKRDKSTYGRETILKAAREASDMYQPIDGFDLKINDLTGAKPKLKPKAFSYDDTGNSGRFLRGFGERVLYSYIHKKWYYYSGKVWVEDDLGKVYEMADYIANSIGKEPIFVSDPKDEKLVEQAEKALNNHKKYTRSFRGKENMLKDTQHHVAVGTDEFDKDKYLFNTVSGYIDLTNGHMMQHQASKKMSRMSYSEYNTNSECPHWEKFLMEIFQGDKELIAYIQRAIGYSMSGDISEQMMFILVGNGQNGKSVFLNVLNDVMGTYAMNIQPQTIAVKQGMQTANSDVARLKGARFVTTTEPNKGMRLDEGTVKQLTGDDKVTARFLYGKEFEYEVEFKIWMATNYKPIITGTDDGIWRRMAIIPFEYKVPKDKVDKKLTGKLKAELSGILNWCIKGYQMWRENGLQEPQVVANQRDEYRSEMDIVYSFVSEKCIINPLASVKKSDLWEEFQDWIKYNNEYDKMGSKRFYIEVNKQFKDEKRRDGTYYVGVGLETEAMQSRKRHNILSNIAELE